MLVSFSLGTSYINSHTTSYRLLVIPLAGYDVPALAESLDWIAVMTYDYHGQWDKKTGHVAPLFFHHDDEFYYFNAVSFQAITRPRVASVGVR